MTATPHILTVGGRRGGTELVHLLRDRRDWWQHLSTPVLLLAVVNFLADDGTVSGTAIPMSHLMITGFVSFSVFATGLINLPQILAGEREDGTLLRMRTVPGGMATYLTAKAVFVAGLAMFNVVVLFGGGVLLFSVPLPTTAGGWLTLAWVLVLSFLAITPLGAAIGAVLPNPRQALAFVMLPVMGMMVISGIFFPTAALPEAVQWVARAFPLMWTAQGVRAALLPEALTVGWQSWQALPVLGAWTVGGALLTPWVLARTARRESGSRLRTRRHRTSQRAGY